MFVAHPTVRLKGSEHIWQPVICSDRNCEDIDRKNHMHCPLCQSASCTTDLAYIKMHFRVKHVDEGLDCKTGFYSLKCYRHCKVVNLRKEKLLKSPHWHCFKCRNAFKRKDDLIVHYQSHRVHKSNIKAIPTTHIVIQKDINQGMLIERNRKSYQTLAKIHPCPAKVPECHQPKNGDGQVPVFLKSYIIHAINEPTPNMGVNEVTVQSPAISSNSVAYSVTEDQIKEDVEIQIVDTRSAGVVHHSEAVASINDSDFPLNPKKNNLVLLKKDRCTSVAKDGATQRESTILSKKDMLGPSKEGIHKNSQSKLSQNNSQYGQHVISVSDQSLALRGRFLSTQGDKLHPQSKDTQDPSTNCEHSSPFVSQCSSTHNGQIGSSQFACFMPSQNDKYLSSNNDHRLSQRTDQSSSPKEGFSLPSKKGQCFHARQKDSVQRDEYSLLLNGNTVSSTNSHDQSSCKDLCSSLDKNQYHSLEDCITQRKILLEEKKQLEIGLEIAREEKNEMADTLRGMTDAISQLQEENKEMSQKLSKLVEENAALRRQLNVITSAIFSPDSSKSSPSSKNLSTSKGKSKSPTVKKTVLITPHPDASVCKDTSHQGSLQFVSHPVVRKKSILPPLIVKEKDFPQAVLGPELHLREIVTKVVNATEDNSQGREDKGKPSRPQDVVNQEQLHTPDKASETTAKSKTSKSESDISSSCFQLESRCKSLHDIFEETSNSPQEHLQSLDIQQILGCTTKSTEMSKQSGDTLPSEVFEADLETQNLGFESFEFEKELLSSSDVSISTANCTDKDIQYFGYMSKNHMAYKNDIKLSTMGQIESTSDQRENSSTPEFTEGTESLLEMFEASLNGEQNLGSIEQISCLPTAHVSEGRTERVASLLLSSLLTSSSENETNEQVGEEFCEEHLRCSSNLTTTDSSVISPSFEISPQKNFEASLFGSNENLSKQRLLTDVLHLDESFDIPQVPNEFSILDKCFDSDLSEKNSPGYPVCPLSALIDDDHFSLSNIRAVERNRGKKRYLEADEIGRPKKKNDIQ